MSEGLNCVMLLGNMGADPELRYTQAGQAVLNMRLATTESYVDKNDERKERTEWHSCVLFGNRAEALSRILKKGSRVFVEGSLRTSSYDDKDGIKRYKTEVNVRNVILSGDRGGSQGDQAPAGDDRGGSRGGGRSGGGGGYRGNGGSGGGRAPAAPPPGDYGGDAGGSYDGMGAGDDSDLPF